VQRAGGKKAAALTLLGDLLKGTIPLLIARAIEPEPLTLALVGMAAFFGHLYPIFFGFKGGKGVATGLGVLLGWHWAAFVATALTWLIVARVGKISSLAALTAFLLAPLYVWFSTGSTELIGATVVLTIVTYWRHRSNISKLLAGTESRIGEKN